MTTLFCDPDLLLLFGWTSSELFLTSWTQVYIILVDITRKPFRYFRWCFVGYTRSCLRGFSFRFVHGERGLAVVQVHDLQIVIWCRIKDVLMSSRCLKRLRETTKELRTGSNEIGESWHLWHWRNHGCSWPYDVRSWCWDSAAR